MASVKRSTLSTRLISRTEDSQGLSDLNSILTIPLTHLFILSETAAYSRIGELEEKVESLTLKGQTYTGDGGSGVYVIGSHDSTPATDHNVYSALRSLIMFMRKDTEERTGFLLSLLGGTVIKKYAKFGDFVTGVSGGYIGEDARAELEALVLRSSLSVPELRFNRQTYFEGYNTISPGGGLIKSFVANSDGSYTVTPDLEDGVPLGQKPDDILLGFWHDKASLPVTLLVSGKYSTVSLPQITTKTFVMVPRPGYEFVPHNEMRLGQTGNFTDKERQTYIIIDVRDGNCCITLVDNANTLGPGAGTDEELVRQEEGYDHQRDQLRQVLGGIAGYHHDGIDFSN